MKNWKFYRYGLWLICVLVASSNAFGQDLGSSNGLFNSPNPKSSKTTTKKTTSKKSSPTVSQKTVTKPRPTTDSKTRPTTKTTKNTAKNTTKNTTKPTKAKKTVEIKKSKPQSTAIIPKPQPPPQNNIVIRVGQPTPTLENFDDLFERAIEDGNAARDERDYTKAEVAYLRAQSLKNGDSRATYGLGNLFSDQQRWEEAERAYRTAIQLEPNSPEAYIALSFVLTQQIPSANLSNRYAEAEQMARQAIKLDAGNAVAFDQLGVALELQGKISDETQNAYKKAIEFDSTFALAYAHLGRLLRRKGLTNESSVAYRTAIQLSTDVPTMILVADVMQSQQRYVESEQLLRRALQQDAKNPTALYLLGRALTIRGSYDEAEKVLKKSADVSPNSFVSYTLLGSLSLRREKFDDAEKYLMKALTVASPNEKKRLAQEFETVGDGYLRVGKRKDAGRVYRQAIALDKEKSALADKLANTLRN